MLGYLARQGLIHDEMWVASSLLLPMCQNVKGIGTPTLIHPS